MRRPRPRKLTKDELTIEDPIAREALKNTFYLSEVARALRGRTTSFGAAMKAQDLYDEVIKKGFSR